jgi:hypothetical protein
VPADRLTPEERTRLGSLAGLLDCERVRLYRQGTGGTSGLLRRLVLGVSGGRPVALGNHVFLPRWCDRDLPVLAHELTHCCQYQAWGPLLYYGRGFITQLRDLLYRLGRVGSSPYRYELEPGKPFSEYGMEQQGQIVEDCFRGHPRAQAISPFWPAKADGPQGTPSA